MPWFEVTVDVDNDEVRKYAILSHSELDACFKARDHFDEIVHVHSKTYDAKPDDDFADFDSVFGA